MTSSAHARSWPNGLEMRQRAANVSLRRAFSASLAGLMSWRRGRRADPAGNRPASPALEVPLGLRVRLRVRGRELAARASSGRVASARASAAATNSRNSGAGRSGRDLNSGWNCEATKNGWSWISMISTRRSSGDVPEIDEPGALQPLAQEVVDLVAVAVALVDHGLVVDLAGARCRRAA